MTTTLLGKFISIEDEGFDKIRVRFLHLDLMDFGSFSLPRGDELLTIAAATFQMDPKKKEGWMAALRSGKYPQSRGALARTGSAGAIVGYCCLGVYCVLHEMPASVNIRDGFVCFGASGIEGSYFPEELADDLPVGHQRVLAKLNDSGWTFEQIAKVIEVCF